MYRLESHRLVIPQPGYDGLRTYDSLSSTSRPVSLGCRNTCFHCSPEIVVAYCRQISKILLHFTIAIKQREGAGDYIQVYDSAPQSHNCFPCLCLLKFLSLPKVITCFWPSFKLLTVGGQSIFKFGEVQRQKEKSESLPMLRILYLLIKLSEAKPHFEINMLIQSSNGNVNLILYHWHRKV